MFRNIQQSFKVFTKSNRFLHTSTANLSANKTVESIKIPQNDKDVEDSKFEKIKKYIQAEVYLWYGLNRRCINPELINEEQWQHLYELEARHQRKRYCEYLLKKIEWKENKKELSAIEKLSKKEYQEEIRAERNANPHLVYGLGHNSLLLRVNAQTINRWYTMKMYRAKRYNQKIVMDCSYESYMTDLERSRVAKGLKRLYSENRKHLKPLDLHLCGVKADSVIIKNLSGQIPTLLSKGSPTEVHTKCFTELFPKERLVMLSPHSDNVLDYNFNDIYVIGAIVDLGRSDPLTLAKAKQLGIRSARLPLDDLRMRAGDSREMPMSSVAAMIRECQINSNMNEIIEKHVYLRSKAQKEREEAEEKELQKLKQIEYSKK